MSCGRVNIVMRSSAHHHHIDIRPKGGNCCLVDTTKNITYSRTGIWTSQANARGVSFDNSCHSFIPSLPTDPTCTPSVPRNQFNIWSFCTRPAARPARRGIANTAAATTTTNQDDIDDSESSQYRPTRTPAVNNEVGDPVKRETRPHKAINMSVPVPRILKKKHFRVKHQKVKIFRANEPLVSVFMWGINHTVSQSRMVIHMQC